eukprot:Skav211275  [mRNA]  locus=scaffold2429:77676:79213:+ [translate_table: standard]
MAPWSVLGIGALLGMLAVDAVFDFGDDIGAAPASECIISRDFAVILVDLRIPVIFSGVCILANLHGASLGGHWASATGSAQLRFHSRSKFHVGTCVVRLLGQVEVVPRDAARCCEVLLLGGLPCFALSIDAVWKMCYSDLAPAVAMSTLRGAHGVPL